MFNDAYVVLCKAGAAKNNLLKKNLLGYIVSAMVAGMFISFGSFFAFSVGQIMDGAGAVAAIKLSQSFCFAAALSLIVMAGAELFTGCNLVMAAASIRKEVSWKDTVILWVVCWLGNLAGSILSVAMFQVCGIPTAGEGAVAAYFTKIALGKASYGFSAMMARAILCNVLVCLAIWCSVKMKSESGKLIMIFWCIMVFMTCGFEHSIANMSIGGVALFNGGISLVQYLYIIGLPTIGNIIGGAVLVALPYHIISNKKIY